MKGRYRVMGAVESKKTEPPGSSLLSIVLTLAFTVGSFVLGHRVSLGAKPVEGGIETTGVVVDHISNWNSEDESWTTVVEFTTSAGESIRFVGDLSSSRVKPVGSKVRVSYDPDEPQGAHNLDGPERWAARSLYAVGIFLVAAQIRQLLRWPRRGEDVDDMWSDPNRALQRHQTGVMSPWAGGLTMIAFGLASAGATFALTPGAPAPIENGVITTGHIVGVVEGSSSRGDSPSHSIYRSQISFTTQDSQTVQFVDPRKTSSRSNHPIGGVVRVSYDPAHPRGSARNLDADTPGVSLVALAISLVLVVVGVRVIWQGKNSRRGGAESTGRHHVPNADPATPPEGWANYADLSERAGHPSR